jgi:hypothetical protein
MHREFRFFGLFVIVIQADARKNDTTVGTTSIVDSH